MWQADVNKRDAGLPSWGLGSNREKRGNETNKYIQINMRKYINMHIFRNNPFFFLQILLHLRKGIPQGATPGPFYSLRHKQHIPPQASCSAFITICQAAYRHLQCFLHRHQPLKSYFLCPKLCSSFNPRWWSCPGISASFSLTPKSSISQSPIDLTSRKPLKSVHCSPTSLCPP